MGSGSGRTRRAKQGGSAARICLKPMPKVGSTGNFVVGGVFRTVAACSLTAARDATPAQPGRSPGLWRLPTQLRRRGRAEPDTAGAAGIATSAPKVGGGPPLQAAPAPPQPRVRSRAIPAAVRRQVWERDRGCSYVDGGSGRRCGSRHLLEIDHVVPYALGGSAEPDNLRLLCAAHHRHRHARRGDTSRS